MALRSHGAEGSGAGAHSGWVPGSPAPSADPPPLFQTLAGEPSIDAAGPQRADDDAWSAEDDDAAEPRIATRATPERAAGTDADAMGAPGGRAWASRMVRSGPWGALAEKWVPDSMRDARINPGRRGAALLSVIAALAAVVAAVGVWWSRPEPTPVLGTASSADPSVIGTSGAEPTIGGSRSGGAATGTSAAGGTPGTGDPSGAATTAASTAPTRPHDPILVSVTGRVRNPGLVTVPADARVADAIAAAGGVLDSAELTGINLAAHVTDGASVVVAGPNGSSVEAETVVAGPDSTAGGHGAGPDAALININTADSQALQQLSGVGPVTAGAIIEYRSQHGRFTDLKQLQEVSGIGPATFARIAPHVTL